MFALFGRSHGTRVLPKILRVLLVSCCEVLCSPARCPNSASHLKLFSVSVLFLITMAAELDESSARLCSVKGQRWGGETANSITWWEVSFDGIRRQLFQTGCGKVTLLLCFILKSRSCNQLFDPANPQRRRKL